MTEHGFFDVLRLTAGDVHPPLYYLILKLSTSLVGDSPAALRLPSILAAAGLVALGAGPVRRIWDARTGWIFSALSLFSSGILCFAQETRMYALATLLVTAAALYGALAVREGRRADFVVLGLVTGAASLTHYFALVAVGMNAVVLLIAAGTWARPRLRPLAVTFSSALLGFLPWIPSFWAQLTAVTRGFWIPETSLELVVFGLVAPFSYKFEDIPYPWQAVVSLGIACSVVTASLTWRRLRGGRSEIFVQIQLLTVFALTLGFGLVFSLLVRPIFMPRYMIVCAGLLLLAVAVGLGRLPGRAPVLLTALLIGLGLPAWMRVQTQIFNGPFARLSREVELAGSPPPVLVHNGFPFSFSLFPASAVLPELRHVVVAPGGLHFDPTSGSPYRSGSIETIHELPRELNEVERIWIVDGIPGADPLDVRSLESSPLWRKVGSDVTLEEPMSWVKLTVRRFERAPAK